MNAAPVSSPIRSSSFWNSCSHLSYGVTSFQLALTNTCRKILTRSNTQKGSITSIYFIRDLLIHGNQQPSCIWGDRLPGITFMMVYHRHEDNFQLFTSKMRDLNLIKITETVSLKFGSLFILYSDRKAKTKPNREQTQLSSFRSDDHFNLPVLLVYIRYVP